MIGPVAGLLGAIQFLTRVPLRLPAAVPHDRVLPWFPALGALIGAAVGGVAVGLGELVPPLLAATLAVLVGLVLTGAFHEDGLADIADAFGGGWTAEQRLAILKDSRHGTYGVTALVSSVVVRVVAAGSIPGQRWLFAGFVAAHTLGRAGALAVAALAPPAVDSGLGADAGRALRPLPAGLAMVSALVVTVAVAAWWAAVLVAVTAAGSLAVTVLALRKIGGIAGDVLGAVEQVVECLVLVAACAIATR